MIQYDRQIKFVSSRFLDVVNAVEDVKQGICVMTDELASSFGERVWVSQFSQGVYGFSPASSSQSL